MEHIDINILEFMHLGYQNPRIIKNEQNNLMIQGALSLENPNHVKLVISRVNTLFRVAASLYNTTPGEKPEYKNAVKFCSAILYTIQNTSFLFILINIILLSIDIYRKQRSVEDSAFYKVFTPKMREYIRYNVALKDIYEVFTTEKDEVGVYFQRAKLIALELKEVVVHKNFMVSVGTPEDIFVAAMKKARINDNNIDEIYSPKRLKTSAEEEEDQRPPRFSDVFFAAQEDEKQGKRTKLGNDFYV